MALLTNNNPTSSPITQGGPTVTPAPLAPGQSNTDYGSALGPSNPLPGQEYYPTNIGALTQSEYNVNPNSVFTNNVSNAASSTSMPSTMGAAGIPASSNPTSSAIANVYQRQIGQNVQGTLGSARMNAIAAGSQQESMIAQQLGQEQTNADQNFLQQYQFQTARQQVFNQWNLAQTQATDSWISMLTSGIGKAIGLAAGGK